MTQKKVSSSTTMKHVEDMLQAETMYTLLQIPLKDNLDAIKHCTKAQVRRFFGYWLQQWNTTIVSCTTTTTTIPESMIELLQRLAWILYEYLQQDEIKPIILEVILEMALKFHDALLSLDQESDNGADKRTTLQQTILSICEIWWKHDLPHKEQLIANALPIWIESPDTIAAVQRLYQLRYALDCIDFTMDERLLAAVLALVSNPFVLKTGKKLLIHLMQNKDLMEPMHQAIKVQMIGNKSKILSLYGEVYYKAYQETTDATIQDALEQIVWSDLVQVALYAADTNTHKAVVAVLQPLHAAQKNHEELLFRLYGPILWRALSASQTQVRLQASQILPAVFPLRGGESHNASGAMEKCLSAMMDLLSDRVPKVRVAGSWATAQVLCDYWTILPSSSIRKLLNWLVTKHASDTSSASVRVGALNAISLVLQNPQSHAVLRPLLPSLGNLLHDKTESVRLATVKMLHRVKETNDLAYYHVVPVFHLNARLANEPVNSSVAAALTSLLLPSYFPSDPTTQIARTLHFIQTDPKAAMIFYGNVYRFLDTAQVAALAAMLWQTVLTAIETETKHKALDSSNKGKISSKRRKKEDNTDESNENGDDEFFSSADIALMMTLTETIHILWSSIDVDCKNDEVVYEFLVEHLEQWLNVMKHFESIPDGETVVRNILKIVRRLPPSDQLHVNADNPNVAGYISVYCCWGRSEDAVHTLAKAMESDLGGEDEILFATPEAKSKKRKSRRRGKSDDDLIELLPSTVALNIIDELLQDPDIRPYLLNRVLERALEKGTKLAEKVLTRNRMSLELSREADMDFLLRVCEMYGRFALHQAFIQEDDMKLSPQITSLLQWISQKVIPGLKDFDESQSRDSILPFNDPDLSTIAAEQSFADWPASPLPSGPPRRRRDTKTTPSRVEVNKLAVVIPDGIKAFATSLVQVACVVFSEWLAVSGGVGGVDIDSQVAEWFSVVPKHSSMLSVMSKLALQLARSCDQYRLLEEILNQGHESNGIIQKMISMLSGPLSKCQLKTVEVVFETAKHKHGCSMQEKDKMLSSLDDLWDQPNSAMAAAFTAIVSNRQSSAVLLEVAKKDSEDSFHKQCMYLLQSKIGTTELEMNAANAVVT